MAFISLRRTLLRGVPRSSVPSSQPIMGPKRVAGASAAKVPPTKQAGIAKFFAVGGGATKPHAEVAKLPAAAAPNASSLPDSPRVKRQKKEGNTASGTEAPAAKVAGHAEAVDTAAVVPAEPKPQLKRLRKGSKQAVASEPSEPVTDLEPKGTVEDTASSPGRKKSPLRKHPSSPRSARQASPEASQRPAAVATLPSADTDQIKASPPAEAVINGEAPSTPRPEPSTSLSVPSDLGSEEAEQAPASKKLKKAVLQPMRDIPKVAGVGKASLAAAGQHAHFDPDTSATWEPGKPVPFSFLSSTFAEIEGTTKRIEIANFLTRALRTIIATTPEDLLPTVYLLAGRVAPSHAGVELGIGDAMLIKALAEATGRKESTIKADAAKAGDLSSIASSAVGKQSFLGKMAPNTIRSVFAKFREIAQTEGQKSQERKRALIGKLLGPCTKGSSEAGYIFRLLQGKLRIGLQEQGLLTALAQAVYLQREGAKGTALAVHLEEAGQAVKQVYSECPSFDELVPALLSAPIQDLPKTVHFKVAVPIKPMLAKPTNGISEVLDKFQDSEFTVEYKYDGERAQVHIDEKGQVSIYSRNSENMTGKYPDLAERMPSLKKAGVKSIVIDGEVVAYDPKQDKILPFQVLSTRKRKGVAVGDIQVQVILFAFDCLFLDGVSLLPQPLTQRREALVSSMTEKAGQLQFATFKTSHDVEELGRFLDESVSAGTEGLIVKSMDSTYEPSKRSVNWLKLKKDYLEGVGDTFDVVPIGAWHGRGKRTGVYGSYLLAIYDEDGEEFQTISKIGTGFSEELLKELHARLAEHVISAPRPYYKWGESLVPEVWFDAKIVWEVKAADLSISPLHKAAAGHVDSTKGISIRFPRYMRTRDDKTPDQATSPEQVAEMFQKQVVRHRQSKSAAAADDD